MPAFTHLTLVGGFLAIAAAQTSTVTQVLLPFSDQQPLDASIIAQSGDVKTLAINCVNPQECGYPEPITVTAGPSTFHYNPTGIYEILAEIDCKITGSSEAFCEATAGIYNVSSLATATGIDDYPTTPAASSSSTSATLTGSDLVWIDVTITAGLVVNATASVTSTSSSGSSRATSASSTRSGSATGSSSAVSASATSNDAAGSVADLAGLVLGMVVLAAPMFLL